jgi:hypothetical protein
MSKMATQCDTSQGYCNPYMCQQKMSTCKPINQDSCRYVNSNDGQAVAACQSAGVCNTLASTGATPDSACTDVLKLCPGAGCEVCKAKMVDLLAGMASAPAVQCQGDKPALPSKVQLCMSAVAPMMSSSSECTAILGQFDAFQAGVTNNNMDSFCRSLGEAWPELGRTCLC